MALVSSDDDITIIAGLVSQDSKWKMLAMNISLKFFVVPCKSATFGYMSQLSLKYFLVDHKRTSTDDLKCASTVIRDVERSHDYITIIVVLVSQDTE